MRVYCLVDVGRFFIVFLWGRGVGSFWGFFRKGFNFIYGFYFYVLVIFFDFD